MVYKISVTHFFFFFEFFAFGCSDESNEKQRPEAEHRYKYI